MKAGIIKKSSKITLLMDSGKAGAQYGGVSPKVIAEINGEKVMIKSCPHYDSDAFCEHFAYKLGTALGLNVNRVEITDKGNQFNLSGICSIHWWEDKFKKQSGSSWEASPTEHRQMNFFDALLDNTDRHGSNYGELNGKLFLIDNGGFSHPWIIDFNEYTIESYSKTLECKEMVEKFMALSVYDFKKMMELPLGLNMKFTKKKKNIIDRMKAIQQHIDKVQKEDIVHTTTVNGRLVAI